MKKYIVILLMLVYALPSTGASLHLHFCCGKLDDVSFSIKHKAGCTEQASEDVACCNNIALDLKIDADQEPLAKLLPQLNLVPALPPVTHHLQAALPALKAYTANKSNGPPLAAAQPPVYIKNCVFRI